MSEIKLIYRFKGKDLLFKMSENSGETRLRSKVNGQSRTKLILLSKILSTFGEELSVEWITSQQT